MLRCNVAQMSLYIVKRQNLTEWNISTNFVNFGYCTNKDGTYQIDVGKQIENAAHFENLFLVVITKIADAFGF